jgi:putative flippase GtrA
VKIKEFLNTRIIKFLAVGAINTAFNYGIYVFLIFIGFGYAIATTVSFVIGLIFNFKTQGIFVFNTKSNKPFYLYLISWLGIYFLNLALLGWLIKIGINSYLAGALLVPPIAVLSFVVLKFVVFREKNGIRL